MDFYKYSATKTGRHKDKNVFLLCLLSLQYHIGCVYSDISSKYKNLINMVEKISSKGFAQGGQILILLFFIPFNLLLLYVGYKAIINDHFDSLVFIFIMVAASFLIIRNAFSYADLYLDNSSITVKKLFSIKMVPIMEYKKIGKALWPFSYYIEFEDKQKVYFLLPLSGIFNEATSLNPDKIFIELRTKFHQLKEKNTCC